MLFVVFLVAVVVTVCVSAKSYESGKEYSVICDSNLNRECKLAVGRSSHQNSRAYGTYIDDIGTDGWGKIWVHGDETEEGWFQAGFLEGALTSKRVYQHFVSWYDFQFGAKPLTENVSKFMMDQFVFAKTLAASEESEYYLTLRKVLLQFEGILAGVNYAAADSSEQLSLLQLLLLDASGDIYDIVPAVDSDGFQLHVGALSPMEFFDRWHRQISCSALTRITPDYSDIVAGHNTWTSYQNMLRLFKHYNLDGGKLQVSLSSKPGMVYSKDDFYALPASQMIVMETTNGVMNKTLYAEVTPKSLLTWQRVPVANTLAKSGKEWTSIMSKHNSGTYANQWMALDLKRFKDAKETRKDLLWIVELAPGIAKANDVSEVLLSRGFWPSYNVPYDKDVYVQSGFQAAYDTYGDHYSYEKCPRAQIFARDAPQSRNFSDMQHILRYNDYQHDPLSMNEPANAIASRYDLRSPNITNSKPNSYGAVDAKLSSYSRMQAALESGNNAKEQLVSAVNGPTHDQQPVFKWSTSAFDHQVHVGQPDVFDFDFVEMQFYAH
jgi:hypothetical protein